MKDAENELFTTVATALREQFPGIFVTGDTTAAPSKFPCVFFEETDHYSDQGSMDTGDDERVVNLTYRADVFSNKTSGGKSEAKTIENAIWEILYQHNFTRFSNTPINDMEKIHHRVATYRVKWDGNCFYRI